MKSMMTGLYMMVFMFSVRVTHAQTVSLENPLGDDTTEISQLVDIIIDVLMDIMIPVVVFFVIYAGFLFVTASGNEQKLTQAKKVLLYTAIGAAIFIAADVISDVIVNTLQGVSDGS